MPVISILNQKGGSGKTTIAINLARAYQIMGHSVLLIDSDKQGSSRDWQSVDENNPLPLLVLDQVSIDRDIKKVIGQYDYIIIDGSPQATEIATATIKASDFILIPMQPSPFDLWASNNLIELIEQGRTVNPKLKAGIVLTRLVKNTKIGAEVGQVISDFGLPVLTSNICQRTCYPYSASLGKTVFDTERPNSEPVKEINSLANEINELIK